MKFDLQRHELSVLYGQLKSLRAVPLRQQRKEIMEMAQRALPNGAPNQLFLAIGSGGEMSQVGAAQSVLDQVMPIATYTVQSQNTPGGKVYTAAVELFIIHTDTHHHIVAQSMASAGLALITATIGCLADIARGGVTELQVDTLRAGGPIVP